MRHQTSNFDFFKQLLDSVSADDLSLPWNSYPCLKWPRGKQKGYGCFLCPVGHPQERRHVRCHRMAFQEVFGPIEDSVSVCHRCDSPSCFRPIHLFSASHQENMQDCAIKGRSRLGRKQLVTTGENNPAAVATEDLVRRVRDLFGSGMAQTKIAIALGLSTTIVNRIVLRQTWTHVL